MKFSLTAALLFSIASTLNAQTVATTPGSAGQTSTAPPHPKSTPYAITSRDANSRTWERTTYERTRSGQWIPHLHRFTELATGMNRFDSATGQWLESKEEIDPAPGGGAQAIYGQHQVYFPPDIYSGVVDILMANGQHVKSRPLGICYYNGTNSVLIAELTNSVGQIISANQVIYTNAFTDFPADLLITYRKSGLECDLVFRSQIPAPEVFGLNAAGCRLELLTEFFDTQDPQEVSASVSPINGLPDSTLAFGPMKMVRGKAFRIGESQNLATRLPVSKTWTHIDGRTFLIEEVLFREIQPSLKTLPALSTAPNTATASANSGLHRVSTSRLLPPQRIAQATTNTMRLAKTDSSLKPGLIWDYNIVNSQSNLTFQGDTTYYVSNTVNLSGTTTIEGGAVIKYDTNYNCSVNILGTVNCQTAPYRPAVFTSANDVTAGEPVSVGHGPGWSCTGTVNFQVQNELSEDLTV